MYLQCPFLLLHSSSMLHMYMFICSCIHVYVLYVHPLCSFSSTSLYNAFLQYPFIVDETCQVEEAKWRCQCIAVAYYVQDETLDDADGHGAAIVHGWLFSPKWILWIGSLFNRLPTCSNRRALTCCQAGGPHPLRPSS